MKKILTNKELFDLLIREEQVEFQGWDFSYLQNTGMMHEFPLTWNYTKRITMEMDNASSLLDMGTGGGEYLSGLKGLPKYTCATEGYKPNIPIARSRLEALGIKVYEVEDDEYLPFDDETFELIINRHESYSPKEVRRILKNNGIFITQQVGGQNDKEINKLLGAPDMEYIDWNLESALNQLKQVDFKILEQEENLVRTRFYDLGAIVYYLKAAPWQVSDFTVERYFDKLVEIYNMIEEAGYIDFTCHRFLIKASKE